MEKPPPVLEIRKVLLSHLLAKVQSMCLPNTFCNADDLTTEIAANLCDRGIINLLENDSSLETAYYSVVNAENNRKHVLGEKLFILVANLESDLCAQITGMLLELDEVTLETLIVNEQQLKSAIYKAKAEYLQFVKKDSRYFNQDDVRKKSEELGEKLYDLVSHYYPEPDMAARLTGMLLELEPSLLRELVQFPEELKSKLTFACSALSPQYG